MDQPETLSFLVSLFAGVDGADAHFGLALTRASVVDQFDTAPSDPSWVPTFDEWFAAAAVADALALQGAMAPTQRVQQFTAEGASFVFDAPVADWVTIAAHLRSRSRLMNAAGMGLIDVGSQSPVFIPRSESAYWGW